MFRLSIAPEIDRLAPVAGRGVILTSKINTFGMGESSVAEKLGPLMDRRRNPVVGTTVSGGVVSVRIRSAIADLHEARASMDETIRLVEEALGPIVYGRDDSTLQESVVALLRNGNQTLATAESCTGGMLGSLLTEVAGASAAYRGGWVTYDNAMKASQLGVPGDMLEKHGAVSAEVALAMAMGALARGGADLALSITGIAGPEGGTREKPVGTVFIGLAAAARAEAFRLALGGDREIIRDRAAKSALQLLRFHLLGVPLETLALGTRA
jgi:nicotinamide-nucleotide amidase